MWRRDIWTFKFKSFTNSNGTPVGMLKIWKTGTKLVGQAGKPPSVQQEYLLLAMFHYFLHQIDAVTRNCR